MVPPHTLAPLLLLLLLFGTPSRPLPNGEKGSGLPSWAFAWCHKTEWAGVHHRELGELQVLLRRVDSPRAIVQKFQDLIVILSQL
jgi:hypothetical protein